MPLLYFAGWLIVQPLLLLSDEFIRNNISLLGTGVTFFLFLLLLPSWINLRWRNSNPWISLGFSNYLNRNILFFAKGLLIAFLLILIVMSPLIWGGWVIEISSIELDSLINAIFLGLGVGFAEEVIFRGWLFGEMNFLLGHRLGIFVQAAIFSISHIRLNMDSEVSLKMLFGLFLFGIVLGIRRKLDSGSLWGVIAMHGGLVGGWFLINNGLIQLSLDSPIWVTGPGGLTSNPIGGIGAITSMSLIIFFQRKALTRF